LNTGAEKKPAKPVAATVRSHQALPYLWVVVHDLRGAGELGARAAANAQDGMAASAYAADLQRVASATKVNASTVFEKPNGYGT